MVVKRGVFIINFFFILVVVTSATHGIILVMVKRSVSLKLPHLIMTMPMMDFQRDKSKNTKNRRHFTCIIVRRGADSNV